MLFGDFNTDQRREWSFTNTSILHDFIEDNGLHLLNSEMLPDSSYTLFSSAWQSYFISQTVAAGYRNHVSIYFI